MTQPKAVKQPQDRKPKASGSNGHREIDLSREHAGEARLHFTCRGQPYSYRAGDLTAREERALYAELGFDVNEWLGAGRMPVWVLGAIVWIFRTRDDAALSYDEAAGDLTADDFDGLKLVISEGGDGSGPS